MTAAPDKPGLLPSPNDSRDFIAENIFSYEHSLSPDLRAEPYFSARPISYALDLFDPPESLRLIGGNKPYHQQGSPYCVAYAGCVVLEWQVANLHMVHTPTASSSEKKQQPHESDRMGPLVVTLSKRYVYDRRSNYGSEGMSAADCMRVLADGVPTEETYAKAQVAKQHHDSATALRRHHDTFLAHAASLEIPGSLKTSIKVIKHVKHLDAATASLVQEVGANKTAFDLQVAQQVQATFAGSVYARVTTAKGLKLCMTYNGPCLMVLPLYPVSAASVMTDRLDFWKPAPSSPASVPSMTSTAPAPVGHAVAVVGYSDHRRAFLLRNSWGSSWGDRGHCWLPYDEFHVAWECWTLFHKGKQSLVYYTALKNRQLPPPPPPPTEAPGPAAETTPPLVAQKQAEPAAAAPVQASTKKEEPPQAPQAQQADAKKQRIIVARDEEDSLEPAPRPPRELPVVGHRAHPPHATAAPQRFVAPPAVYDSMGMADGAGRQAAPAHFKHLAERHFAEKTGTPVPIRFAPAVRPVVPSPSAPVPRAQPQRPTAPASAQMQGSPLFPTNNMARNNIIQPSR